MDGSGVNFRLGRVCQEHHDDIRSTRRFIKGHDVKTIRFGFIPAGKTLARPGADNDLQPAVPQALRLGSALDAVPQDCNDLAL